MIIRMNTKVVINRKEERLVTMKRIQFIVLGLLTYTFVCCSHAAVSTSHPRVTPFMDAQTNNTTLIYSGIVAVPIAYFSINPKAYTVNLNSVDTQSCNTQTHHYTAKAVISDTTASRNDHRVENRCAIEGVAVNSVNVTKFGDGAMTIQLLASTVKDGWSNSGAAGSETAHYCSDLGYVKNSINGDSLIDHVQLDVYCVPNTVGG